MNTLLTLLLPHLDASLERLQLHLVCGDLQRHAFVPRDQSAQGKSGLFRSIQSWESETKTVPQLGRATRSGWKGTRIFLHQKTCDGVRIGPAPVGAAEDVFSVFFPKRSIGLLPGLSAVLLPIPACHGQRKIEQSPLRCCNEGNICTLRRMLGRALSRIRSSSAARRLDRRRQPSSQTHCDPHLSRGSVQ